MNVGPGVEFGVDTIVKNMNQSSHLYPCPLNAGCRDRTLKNTEKKARPKKVKLRMVKSPEIFLTGTPHSVLMILCAAGPS